MSYDIRPYVKYSPSEILNLYESVGWLAYTQKPDILARAFKNSLLTLTAFEDNQLIGLIRAVGDGETIVFIQDILVHPDHQRKGVGTMLVNSLLKHFPSVRQIQLTTDNSPKSIAFYNSLGFKSHSEIGLVGFMAVK